MTTKTTKLIRTIYLYVAALISLIFVAVGVGRIANTALKAYVFPEAEKGGFNACNQQPPMYVTETQSVEKLKNSEVATPDQKIQIEELLANYKAWQENNSGDICYKRQRQTNYVDSFTMLLIALPICLIHWRIIKRDKEEKEADA